MRGARTQPLGQPPPDVRSATPSQMGTAPCAERLAQRSRMPRLHPRGALTRQLGRRSTTMPLDPGLRLLRRRHRPDLPYPGPDMVYVMPGRSRGRVHRHAALHADRRREADTGPVARAVAVAALSALAASSATAFHTLRLVGAAYLL